MLSSAELRKPMFAAAAVLVLLLVVVVAPVAEVEGELGLGCCC